MLGVTSDGGLIATILSVVALFLIAIFGAIWRLGNTVGQQKEMMANLAVGVQRNTSELRSQGGKIANHSTRITVLERSRHASP